MNEWSLSAGRLTYLGVALMAVIVGGRSDLPVSGEFATSDRRDVNILLNSAIRYLNLISTTLP